MTSLPEAGATDVGASVQVCWGLPQGPATAAAWGGAPGLMQRAHMTMTQIATAA